GGGWRGTGQGGTARGGPPPRARSILLTPGSAWVIQQPGIARSALGHGPGGPPPGPGPGPPGPGPQPGPGPPGGRPAASPGGGPGGSPGGRPAPPPGGMAGWAAMAS